MELNDQKYYSELEIPKSEEIFYFEHSVYDNAQLGQFITKENFDYILTEAEKIVCDCTVRKEKYERLSIKSWVYILGIASIISFIIFFIILYNGPRYENGKTLNWISISFGIFALLIILVLMLFNLLKRKTYGKTIDDFIYDQLTKYFARIQNQLSENIYFKYDKKKKALILKYPNPITYKKSNHKNELAFDSEYNLLRSKESRKRGEYIEHNVPSNLNFQKKYHGKFKSDF